MKLIPKFQSGNKFNAYFTTYEPIQISVPQQASEKRSAGTSNNNDNSTKGRLTEKDLFEMVKDIDGLPNEMQGIVNRLMNSFQMSQLTGVDVNNLATTYLSNLYQIKVAAQNKKKYDEAFSNANKNGALGEPAISLDGQLIVQTSDGKIAEVPLETYFSNQGEYTPLTISNLANMRAYDQNLAYNQTVFDIMNNSIGYESFQELLKSAIQSLGTTEYSKTGMFSNEGQASKGLALLQTLSQDDRVQALGSVTANGLYEYKIIDKTQLNQLNALTQYISSVFPERAKVWASIKTQIQDKNKALQNLVFTYLLSSANNSHSFDIQYKGDTDKTKKSSSSGSGSAEDPKKGFWSQVQSGHGGDDFRFTILSKNGSMSIDGKFHGTTPGMDSNKSLGDYINSSRVGYLIKNNKNITFGDQKISVDSFNDVMVNSYSGAAVVTLPINPDGSVDLKVSERWVNVQDQLDNSGLQPNTPQYLQKRKQLMSQNSLDGLIKSDGTLNSNRFGHFLVLEGYTSDKAYAVQDNKKVSFKDIDSNFIISAGDDEETYDMIRSGLSSKDRGDYDLSSGWFGSDLYKGNIYIPLNTNLINGYNADQNDIKESTSYLYEKAQQQFSTNSNVL